MTAHGRRCDTLLSAVCLALLAYAPGVRGAQSPQHAEPLVGKDVVFGEAGGVIVAEAEHFFAQERTQTRAWYLFAPGSTPTFEKDADPPHLPGASGGAYLEILPDTRQTHGDPLRSGENFSNEPGKMAVLHYRVHVDTPGTWYVWARIYSTGGEDNGLHVGLDGRWPESGQRMQWTAKRQWVWGSKQRTQRQHGGQKHKLFLEIPKPGPHVISFSMREDGTEFDKWMMTRERLDRVEGLGPMPTVTGGTVPEPFAAPDTGAARSARPASAPPAEAAPEPESKSTAADRPFDPKRDLLSLHYDHAPDRDDGHSAAADRTLLETRFGPDWLPDHVLAVSGAYGKNKGRFVDASDKVMETVWGPRGGWLDAHADRDKALAALVARWHKTLEAGGDVWVKEGGQSDLTADAVRAIKKRWPDLDTTRRIHTVQHSNWNERQTTDADLAYVKEQTDYLRIKDANRYLNKKGGDDAFEAAAIAHPTFGPSWKAAFAYYDPDHRLDFSDTGELMHILGLGEMDIDAFREAFLQAM